MAVLLKHHDLGHVALSLVDHGLSEVGNMHGLPRSIAEVCKVVHHAKRNLIKVSNGYLYEAWVICPSLLVIQIYFHSVLYHKYIIRCKFQN